jgi:hypothetical protein
VFSICPVVAGLLARLSFRLRFVAFHLMLSLALASCLSAQTAATNTVLTNTGSAGNYTLTGAVRSTAATAGGPTGQVSFIDQTTSATLGSALLSTPVLTTGTFTSTDSLSFSVFEPAAAPVKYCGYKQMGQVVTTDFDGDGNLDLAFAGTFICSASDPFGAVSSSAIFLAQGNGDGTFELIPPYGAPENMVYNSIGTGIAVGNFGSPIGRPGFVLVSTGNYGAVATMADDQNASYNNTVINLPTATGAVAVGPNSAWVAVGTTSGLNIYNNAAGSLSQANTFSISGGASLIAVTKYGLAVGSCPTSTTGALTILTGSTSTGLQVSSTSSLPGCIQGIGAGNFHSTAPSDLIVDYQGPTGNSQLLLVTDNGSGNYTQQTAFSGGFANMGNITAADLDNDGKTDFAVTDFANAMFSIYYGNGDGSFKTPVNVSIPAVAVGATSGSEAWIAAGAFTKNTPGLAISATTNLFEVLQSSSSGSMATASITGLGIPGTGTHQVVANYVGDTNFASSPSNAVALTASPVMTTLSLTASPTSLVSGQSTTLTATLSPFSLPGLSTNGETITFKSGSQTLGTGTLASGVATFPTSSLPVGTDSITASYGGDAILSASSAAAINVVVTATTIGLSSSSSSLNIANPGGSASTTLTLSSQSGFNGAVNLACVVNFLGTGTARLPPTCSLNSSSVQLTNGGSASRTLTVNTTGNTASNEIPSLRHTGIAVVGLLLLGLIPRRRRPAAWLFSLLMLAALGTIAGCGSGSTPPTSTSQTTVGSYNVVVTATSGSTMASTTIPLVVQ